MKWVIVTPMSGFGQRVTVDLRLCAIADESELGCGVLKGIELVSPHRITCLGKQPTYELGVHFGDTLELEGYDLQASGGRVKVVLYWKVLSEPATRLKRFVHVLGENGRIMVQDDALLQHPEKVPFFAWVEGEYLVDRVELSLPLTSGYSIKVGVYDPDTGKRLPVMLENGSRSADDALCLEAHSP